MGQSDLLPSLSKKVDKLGFLVHLGENDWWKTNDCAEWVFELLYEVLVMIRPTCLNISCAVIHDCDIIVSFHQRL